MAEPKTESDLVAACLRGLERSEKTGDVRSVEFWLGRADIFLKTGGSTVQRNHIEQHRARFLAHCAPAA